MKIKLQNNRLGIYFFYDKYGIVDHYVDYFLGHISEYFKKIIIVCNGNLTQDGKKILKHHGKVIVRENVGFDVWAYKTVIDALGWKEIEKYEEFVMFNSTIMGPVKSFQPMFSKMDQEDLDFWGITMYPKNDSDPFHCISYGYIPEHLQSHFIAVRRSLFEKDIFQEYWQNIPKIHSYEEAIGKHEAIFTKYFADLGFRWDAYVDSRLLSLDYTESPILMCPLKLIREYGCPIFKRRSFFHFPEQFLSNTTGEQTSELFSYLRDETDYPIDMIWENILRLYPQDVLVKNLNLTYILPTNVMTPSKFQSHSKVALVIHLFFEDLVEENKKYIQSMPEDADLYITTPSLSIKEKALQVYDDIPCHYFEVRVIPNRGRDVGALLIGVQDIILDYDIVCFAHDKKSAQVQPHANGISFAYKCFMNVLANKNFVHNVIQLFENNPRLGILCPPEPNHGNYYPTLGSEWGPNYEGVLKLANKLKLKVPIDINHPPIAPFGTLFWFRPKALEKLFHYFHQWKQLPKEPLAVDGTLLHMIERLYPFVAQDAGYYPAILMSDTFAAIEYQNLHFYCRTSNLLAFQLFGRNTYYGLVYNYQYLLQNNGTFKNDVRTIFICMSRIGFKIVKKICKLLLPTSCYGWLNTKYHKLRGIS